MRAAEVCPPRPTPALACRLQLLYYCAVTVTAAPRAPTPQDSAEEARASAGARVAAAAVVGKRIAEKAIAAGVDTVAFDRSGFRYHGRVKALADAAREGGLKF